MMQGLKKLLQGDREPIGVVLAGGCGGFLAAIYGEVVGQPILDDWRGWVFSVFLGMGAGFVGVAEAAAETNQIEIARRSADILRRMPVSDPRADILRSNAVQSIRTRRPMLNLPESGP